VNQVLAANTARFAGATTVKSPVIRAPILVARPVIEIGPPLPASLPLVSSRNGNLFQDRNDLNLHWYLPDFNLADDIDPGFTFVASQIDSPGPGGAPSYTARLTLRMHKSQPDDVVNFAKENTTAKLQEIPLAEISAILVSAYTDNKGQPQQSTVSGTLQDLGNGDQLLTFYPILADMVPELYENLTLFGKAVINLSASYQAWSKTGALFLLARRQELGPMNAPATMNMRMLSTRMQTATVAPRASQPVSFIRMEMPSAINQRSGDTLVQASQAWSKQLPMGIKYKRDGYQLKYTLSTATVSNHVILDADDLKDFTQSQSEFTELKVINVSQYPSLKNLYMGVLSRTIVMIPRRYSVVRSRTGCQALCVAVVDSSPGSGSGCKFEFDFTIAPEVSRIEIYKLQQEIKSIDSLKDYTLKLPDFLRDTPPSTLDTQFKSNAQIKEGPFAQTFVVTVSIQDDGVENPAVANANAFIMRLSSSTGADLTGSLSIKLDKDYPEPVPSPIDLNFGYTAGSDHEIDVQIIEESSEIKLTNQLPLDLQISSYALIQGSTIAEVPGVLALPANGWLTIPLPNDHADLTLAIDAQLLIPEPMSKSDIMKFLDIRTADVQQTQYVVAVNGSGIDFNKVDSVEATITFSNLPNMAPTRALKLNKDLHADSIHIVIPLASAVFSLPGTVNLAVHFGDPGLSDLEFTLENDFAAEPVLIILQGDIDKNLPKT
jgi:hypothetical protein